MCGTNKKERRGRQPQKWNKQRRVEKEKVKNGDRKKNSSSLCVQEANDNPDGRENKKAASSLFGLLLQLILFDSRV